MTEPLGLVRALASIGSVERAVELVETALTLGLPTDLTARLSCLLVELRMAGGDVPHALATAEDILGTEAPPSVHGAVTAGRMFGRYFQNAAEGRRHAEAVLSAHGGRIDAGAEVPAAAAVLSDAVFSDGRVAEGLRLVRAAAATAPQMPSPLWRAYLQMMLAERLVDAGACEEAERVVQAARADVGALNDDGVDLVFAHLRTRLLSHQGRLAEARDEAHQALATAVGRGARLYVPPLLAALGQFALRFGDINGATTYVRRYREALGTSAGHVPSTAYDWVELQLTAARHGAHGALQPMNRHYATPDQRAALFVRHPDAAAWFVRTALAAGDIRWATLAATTARRLAERNPGVPTLATAALHVDSLLRGDPDGLVRAATEHGDHWARTTAAEDLAKLLDTRSRRPPSPDRPAEVAPPETLTDVELAVARLVSEGLTNQQVAFRLRRSPHTVNYHLRNIFRKLAIGSRVELARHTRL
ncbi:LuxR C-terminal-related transcriptional regulator [Streptomyces sp. NPDC048420]|uniref:LuxR C-terminal-related transcriptional regulator n=1 Tax=Streptomyces sp. NPDC048420 TaxID=3155755 RepID=UPI0034335949